MRGDHTQNQWASEYEVSSAARHVVAYVNNLPIISTTDVPRNDLHCYWQKTSTAAKQTNTDKHEVYTNNLNNNNKLPAANFHW